MNAMTSIQTSITACINKARDFLRHDYEQNRLTIDLIRYIALWGHPLYYVICAILLPQPYESLELRFASPITFIPLLFYKRYPDAFKPWLNLYWYLWITFSFPFIFTFLMLMNQMSGLWLVAETVMLVVFMIFIPNYFILFTLLVAGLWSAYVAYVQVTGEHLSLTTDIIENFVSIPIAVLLGLVLNYTNKKGAMAHERNRLLQSLAGSIAHEMRNPLGQVRQCLNSIQKILPPFRSSNPSISMTGQNLNRIYQRVSHGQIAVKRGTQVIDMILGEIRESPIDPESFSYASAGRIIRKALDEYGYENEDERQRVSADTRDSFICHISETLFIFVIFNLLKNALYYIGSHTGSHISIRLKKGEKVNTVFFRDTGPGISPEELPHIFDSFHTKGKKDGTGLGLAYCKRIMNAFGGDISCDSIKGSYTEFTLTFPVVAQEKLQRFNAHIIDNARPDFHGKRILAVDDEQSQRLVIEQFLRPLGVHIDLASNGPEALAEVSNSRYDLIIMDINMPGMNGYETVEQLRMLERSNSAPPVPIVAYSAEPAYIAGPMAEKAGMQAMISKPCSQAELINALRSVLRRTTTAEISKHRLDSTRILLVDDSALNRELLAMVLTDAGLHPAIAVNGEDGWNMLQKERFDMLITDIHMPGLDGLDLTRRIRESRTAELRELPIIGLSGSAEEETAARNAGMNDFKLKTETPENLINTIKNQLSTSRAATHCPSTQAAAIDLKRAAEATGLSEDNLKQLFRTFLEQTRDKPAIIQQALDMNELEKVQAEAHTIKGSAAVFGAEELSSSAHRVEHSCRNGTTENLAEQVGTMLRHLQQVRNFSD
ncbi:response regulator [Prosthecochloris sp. ZM_2]|nr:response regulator [Prosthecochloris sp. ZM_2]